MSRGACISGPSEFAKQVGCIPRPRGFSVKRQHTILYVRTQSNHPLAAHQS